MFLEHTLVASTKVYGSFKNALETSTHALYSRSVRTINSIYRGAKMPIKVREKTTQAFQTLRTQHLSTGYGLPLRQNIERLSNRHTVTL
jgi:hypothetical protein